MPLQMYEVTPIYPNGTEGKTEELPAIAARPAGGDYLEKFVTGPEQKQPCFLRVVNTVTELTFYFRPRVRHPVEYLLAVVTAADVTEELATLKAQQLAADMAVGKALLCRYFEFQNDWPFDFQQISDRLYAETECGAWLEERPGGIALGCIIEGSEAICQTHELTWAEVSKERLDEVIAAIEEEADILFKEAHGQTEVWDNMARALSVVPAIELFRESAGMQEEPIENVLTDLVANLQHYCREHKICFASTLRKANDHFTEELHVEGQQQPKTSLVLAKEVAEVLHDVHAGDALVYACSLRLINKLLQGQKEELNAPLDEAEERFMTLLQHRFKSGHQLWQHICVTTEVAGN